MQAETIFDHWQAQTTRATGSDVTYRPHGDAVWSATIIDGTAAGRLHGQRGQMSGIAGQWVSLAATATDRSWGLSPATTGEQGDDGNRKFEAGPDGHAVFFHRHVSGGSVGCEPITPAIGIPSRQPR